MTERIDVLEEDVLAEILGTHERLDGTKNMRRGLIGLKASIAIGVT